MSDSEGNMRNTVNLTLALMRLLAFIALAIILILVGTMTWETLVILLGSRDNLIRVIIVWLMAGFFPLTATIYYLYRRPVHKEQVSIDFSLIKLQHPHEEPIITEDSKQRFEALYKAESFAVLSMFTFMTVVAAMEMLFGADTPLTARVDERTLQALQYGFLGSYAFSLRLVYRRYTTFDLQPYVYLYSALTFFGGFVFNFVLFEVIEIAVGSTTPIAGGVSATFGVLSFALGYFPALAIRTIERLAYTAMGGFRRRSSRLPLKLIDGISIFDEVRLLDEGIDNVQNLASARIDELLLSTRFTAQQVVEWVDQAILYAYLGDSDNSQDMHALIDQLTRLGIRSVTDIRDQWIPQYEITTQPHSEPGQIQLYNYQAGFGTTDDEATAATALSYQRLRDQVLSVSTFPADSTLEGKITRERLDALYRATRYGTNIHLIRNYWRNLERVAREQQTRTIRDILKELGNKPGQETGDKLAELSAGEKQALVSQVVEQDVSKTIMDTMEVDVLLGAARLATNTGHYQKAVDYYLYIINTHPHISSAYNDLAWLYLNQPDIDDKSAIKAEILGEQAIAQVQNTLSPLGQAAYKDTLAAAKLARLESDPDLSLETKNNLIREADALLTDLEAPDIYENVPDYGRQAIVRHRKMWNRLSSRIWEEQREADTKSPADTVVENLEKDEELPS